MASTIARYKRDQKCLESHKVFVQKDLSHIKSRQDLIESVLKAWSKLNRVTATADVSGCSV